VFAQSLQKLTRLQVIIVKSTSFCIIRMLFEDERLKMTNEDLNLFLSCVFHRWAACKVRQFSVENRLSNVSLLFQFVRVTMK
jgi:hypothetical protein